MSRKGAGTGASRSQRAVSIPVGTLSFYEWETSQGDRSEDTRTDTTSPHMDMEGLHMELGRCCILRFERRDATERGPSSLYRAGAYPWPLARSWAARWRLLLHEELDTHHKCLRTTNSCRMVGTDPLVALPAAGSVAAALNSMSAAANAASGTVAGRPASRQLRPRLRLLGGRRS